MPTVNLLPNAEGSVQQWFTSGIIPSHWTKVDDPVGSPDEDSTYVYETTSNDVEEFNHVTSDVLKYATITNVRLTARLRYVVIGEPSQAYVNLGLKIAGRRYAAPLDIPISTSYVDYNYNWTVNPDDGQPWEKSDIDALQSSIMAKSLGNAQERCTQVYITVTYIFAPVSGRGLTSWTP